MFAKLTFLGEIISQQKVPVSKDIKLPELTEQLSKIGAEMLVECLRNLPHSLENAQPQCSEGVTYGIFNKVLMHTIIPCQNDFLYILTIT